MTTDRAIDTVVYDFGNVLVHWDPRPAFAHLAPAVVDRFFTEVDFTAFNHHQDAGRSLEDGRAALADVDPRWAGMLDAYLDGYPRTLTGLVEGSAELVGELKGRGLRLYGLTNWWAQTFHHAEALVPAVGLMDGVVVSGRESLAKPDPAIFRLLADRFAVDPRRAVFVDDSAPNVEAAAAVGFRAVHFTTTADFRRALRDLGVPVEHETR
ncbi:HAD-superfamily hydrolase, subfamily IA, variant 3 [Xylanimonas cellulosilytica DSM 15894]|uniref:HAD-superfamily hydrolase, subfamily IA, variant 3 n=1 Tax=Xylanimonas cellulosilytica (strain DSM 15894 / JCM 12276 / CECT 5975 / KCTC 9989 / LMG 20990 / NBRC 107835 / XIL07) TaxID=446471 RepID=D1BSQ1_XYLCX|nr:HAD family phosphatase [Xylanimonas cellulosilytica]ACZ30743.1 HAD-superfamily hydrolase, subfamily IA, variant 3 [Xylanimonas cellulosilytica DSM 15894]